MRRSRARVAQVALLIVLVGGASASAQIGGNGSIQGTVLDTSKAALPGVTVTATNIATGIETVRVTTEAGVYTLAPLPPGEYRVTAALNGFETFAREGVIVDGLAVVGLNVMLQLAGVKQEVLVTAAPLALSTADARLGQTIRNDVYTALPLVMNTGGPRDPTAFMFLMPGVQSIGRWGNVMGGQDFTTDMYVEGIPITNAVVQGEGRNLSFGFSVEAVELRRQIGNEHVSRQRLRVLPPQVARLESVLRDDQAGRQPARIRRYGRRADSAQPDVLLRRVRRLPGSASDPLRADLGPDACRPQWRLQRIAGPDFRSANDQAEPERDGIRARPVSQQHHSVRSHFADLALLPVVPA
jgi:hypothetical protein